MKFFTTYRIIFLVSTLFLCFNLRAQSPIAIEASEFVTTTIFFPSNIKKVIAPGVNFQFKYEEGSNIGLLRGRKGRASNLLVITELGYAYSFALSYAEEVLDFNFILTTDQAITKNKSNLTENSESLKTAQTSTVKETTQKTRVPEVYTTVKKKKEELITKAIDSENKSKIEAKALQVQSNTVIKKDNLTRQNESASNSSIAITKTPTNQDNLYDTNRKEYYEIYCQNNYLQKTIFKRSFRQHKKIAVRLNNILVDRNEKYFVLQIENNSKEEYKVEGLSFFKKIGVGQLEKIMTPLYSYNLQETIDPESINEVVYVFSNFKINGKEKITITLADANSDNMVILPLDNLVINSPTN